MKTLKLFVLLALAGGTTGCADLTGPGDIFGPNTAKAPFSIIMENAVCDDVWKPTIDYQEVTPELTLQNPTGYYEVRVHAYRTYRDPSGVEYGQVPVSLYSTRRQRAVEKPVSFRTDRTTVVKFHESDFFVPTQATRPCG